MPHDVFEFAKAKASKINKRTALEVASWLPVAADAYGLSRNIDDYVISSVIILTSDLPNRNNVAFPASELLKWNEETGTPTFKSWRGKRTFLEHNHDPAATKGLIFDTTIKATKNANTPIMKVIGLAGWDKTKDPNLAAAIQNGKRPYFSMGASVSTYECSICGATSPEGQKDTKCGHVVRGRMKFFDTARGKKPAYYICSGITGFELSSVSVPAWAPAETIALL